MLFLFQPSRIQPKPEDGQLFLELFVVGEYFPYDPPELIIVPHLFEMSDLMIDHIIDQFSGHILHQSVDGDVAFRVATRPFCSHLAEANFLHCHIQFL